MNDTYITLTGWVGSDVSLREVAGGQPVANFRVATTSRKFRNNQWEDGTTTWYSIRAWRRLADNVHGSIKRGDPVVVHGRLEADVWTKEDGTTNTQLVVTAYLRRARPVAWDGRVHQAGPARGRADPAGLDRPVGGADERAAAFASDAPAAPAASVRGGPRGGRRLRATPMP